MELVDYKQFQKYTNPLFYDLINEFYKTTDVPVLINTSMNVRGEPIVNTIEQAYNMIVKNRHGLHRVRKSYC